MPSIDSYDIPRGTLRLVHQPVHSPSPEHRVVAYADINLLVGMLKSEVVAPGTWVNVIGYVSGSEAESSKSQKQAVERQPGQKPAPLSRLKSSKSRVKPPKRTAVKLQAVMVWPAGSIDIGAYERAVMGRNEIAAVNKAVSELEE